MNGAQLRALGVAVSYAIAAAAWIAWSDRMLAGLGIPAGEFSVLHTYKGWAFVAVTAVLLFVEARGWLQRVENAQERTQESLERLSLALSSASGGIWDRDLSAGTIYIAPEAKALIGFADDEFPSDREAWLARVHREDLAALRRSTSRAIADPGGPPHDVRYRIRHADGGYRWLHSRARTLTDDGGRAARMLGVVLDVTEAVEAEHKVDHLLRHNPLTDLPNRATFAERLDAQIASYGDMARLTAVARMDVDHFKHVNDRFGTEAGDAVLRAVAGRIREAAGEAALVGHIAGDEFVAAVPRADTHAAAQGAVERLAQAFDQPFEIDGVPIRLTVSIGAAVYPDNGDNADELLKSAAVALAKGRKDGRARARFHTPELDRSFRLKGARAQDLRHAAERGEMELHYQPVVDLAGGRTMGFEALVRWRRPGEGLVPPDEFVGLAEELGFIDELGEAVLRMACADTAGWTSAEGGRAPLVAVNVSPRQFDDVRFVTRVGRVLGETGLDPARLEIEVTETALARDPHAAAGKLDVLRRLGASVAVDDFGTGYSSLGSLQMLPLSRLKIDKSLIAHYVPGSGSAAIADTILNLADTLGIPVTAEGVETPAQLEALRRKGAQAAQGYLFSRPVRSAEAASLIDRRWLGKGALAPQ